MIELPAVDAEEFHGDSITLDSVTKKYGSVTALDSVSLDVAPGEFIALLGPSGSGKTSMLMTIAGFEAPTSGTIHIGDRDVTGVPPYRRGLGMVFQNYALFPHLTVARNVAYPLRTRGIRGARRDQMVTDALQLVDLQSFADRRIDQLSGGQQQRVALARALVFRPPVLLMDEPLGALDRKLREQVQLEIRRLHKQLKTTILYVTHDQDEALVMADRIAVMSNAHIQQVGTPQDLYRRPANPFVAGFLGKMNFLDGEAREAIDAETVSVDTGGYLTDVQIGQREASATGLKGTSVVVAVRPEDVEISHTGPGLRGVVAELIFAGPRTKLVVDTHGTTVEVEMSSGALDPTISEGLEVHLSWQRHAALAYRSTSK